MTVISLSSDETVAKAEEAFSLGLITQGTMERVIQKARSNPEYDPIMDLPFDWEMQHERELRKALHRKNRRANFLLKLRRLV